MRLIRKKEVLAATGFKNSTLYKYIAEGSFPKPVTIGGRAKAWVESEVIGWMNDRIKERDEGRS
ncbi:MULTISPECIES: helix-turn-helix transcriptional regulator [Pseudomonadaceae]|uniref:helix-turn-helix transcriptional regulator n=1 Tax=Pseudomonadaceae TaxID=135621 RepID=UPI00103E26F6|nr:AlpA family transcriptional regulator [Pseudomonas sp. IC_126]MCQ4256385.1 AlpA family transcriptional regulator [Stutzerimonas stutzeri]TCD18154.1 AlpA family transcriptional regulator [Pseudomonas sp. IC_126]